MKIKKSVWIITDIEKGLIAKGVPRNRYLCLVNDKSDNKRILTYPTKKVAERAFKDYGFYTLGTDDYFLERYGLRSPHYSVIKDYLEAVEATVTLRF
jgi:hypothetical protein